MGVYYIGEAYSMLVSKVCISNMDIVYRSKLWGMHMSRD